MDKGAANAEGGTTAPRGVHAVIWDYLIYSRRSLGYHVVQHSLHVWKMSASKHEMTAWLAHLLPVWLQ